MNSKFCSYCSTFRPEDKIEYEYRGSPSRKVKKVICTTCKESRDANQSLKGRTAFGAQVTERNKRLASSRWRTIQDNKNNKDRFL